MENDILGLMDGKNQLKIVFFFKNQVFSQNTFQKQQNVWCQM